LSNSEVVLKTDNSFSSIWGKISAGLSKFESAFSGICLIISTTLMTYEVIARYFLKSSTYWAEEWAPFLIVWSACIGVSTMIHTDGHISVELFRNKMKKKSAADGYMVNVYLNILVLIFCVFFLLSSISMVQDAIRTKALSESRLQTPMYIPYSIMPVAVTLMIIRTLERVVGFGYKMLKEPSWYKTWLLPVLLGITVLGLVLIITSSSPLALLMIMLFGLLFLGVPVTFSLGLASLIVFMNFDLVNYLGMANKFFWSINKFSLMAIPFFMLSGNIMAKGKLGEYLLNFANSFLRNITGGLGIAILGAAVIFGAISGASAASAAAIGAMALPMLVKQNYPKKFGAGLIAAGGTLAVIIPPSGILVLYGGIAGQSITDLFFAGIVPGILIAAILSFYVYIVSKKNGYGEKADKFDWEYVKTSFKKAIGALLLPVGILGSIYSGICTPTEVAAVSCFYAAIVCIYYYKDVTWKQMFGIIVDSVNMTAMIFAITMTAAIFGFIISYEQLPGMIFEAITRSNINWWQFLLILNLIVFAMGFFLGPSAILLIAVPIVLPVCERLGIHPVHLGICMTVNMELAFLTPPVGANLYVLTRVSGLPLVEVIKGTIPFIAMLLICLGIIIFFPQLSLLIIN